MQGVRRGLEDSSESSSLKHNKTKPHGQIEDAPTIRQCHVYKLNLIFRTQWWFSRGLLPIVADADVSNLSHCWRHDSSSPLVDTQGHSEVSTRKVDSPLPARTARREKFKGCRC